MLISHKHKFITIDIPKTGSRSLRESLSPLNILDIVGLPDRRATFYQHGSAIECKNSLKNIQIKYDEYHTFCVVRNPWERYCSYLRYFKMYAELYRSRDSSIKWTTPEVRQGESCVDMFENKTDTQVLEHIIDKYPAQHHYYMHNDKIIVDHIAEFSRLSEEFESFCTHVGLSCNLKHKNKTSSTIYIYPKKLRDIVSEKESHVIELMEYKYND